MNIIRCECFNFKGPACLGVAWWEFLLFSLSWIYYIAAILFLPFMALYELELELELEIECKK